MLRALCALPRYAAAARAALFVGARGHRPRRARLRRAFRGERPGGRAAPAGIEEAHLATVYRTPPRRSRHHPANVALLGECHFSVEAAASSSRPSALARANATFMEPAIRGLRACITTTSYCIELRPARAGLDVGVSRAQFESCLQELTSRDPVDGFGGVTASRARAARSRCDNECRSEGIRIDGDRDDPALRVLS